jgi:hypothetical protein
MDVGDAVTRTVEALERIADALETLAHGEPDETEEIEEPGEPEPEPPPEPVEPEPLTFIGANDPDPALWTLAFADDFDVLCERKEFLKTYPGWHGYPLKYPTTDKTGRYDPNQVSVVATYDEQGHPIQAMDVLCTPVSPGQHLSAAMFPAMYKERHEGGNGTLGMRVEQRIRTVDGDPGWHLANLTWPMTDNWPWEGELDYWEGKSNADQMAIFVHMYEGKHPADQEYARIKLDQTQFNVVCMEWLPGESVKWYVNGDLIRTFTNRIPPIPMRLVLQIESSGLPVRESHVQYDWVRVHLPR